MNIKAPVKLNKATTIPGLQVSKLSGTVKMPVQARRLNITTEGLPGQQESKGIETLETYATIQGGNNRVSIAIRNVTREPIRLKKGAIVGMVSTANVIPPMLAAKASTDSHVLENEANGTPNANVPEERRYVLVPSRRSRTKEK